MAVQVLEFRSAQLRRHPLALSIAVLAVLGWFGCPTGTSANPTGHTVTQGTAAFSTTGSQLDITTSGNAYINWQTFNIAAGETTYFHQPSTSIVWNNIADPNASTIDGSLRGDGFIVLQNPNGFVVGGTASITAHGLLMTTAPIPTPDLSSGGPWQFSAPPPAAKIVNYGKISTDNGGSVFLIANDVENLAGGEITAPGGSIGLCAGQQVLVSQRPDGRGLTAKVTLPQGSVDNEGHVTADGGSILLNAQVVNQGGLVQANLAQTINGTIELVAGDALSLAAGSKVQADGGVISMTAKSIDAEGTVQANSVQLLNGTTARDITGSIQMIAANALTFGAASLLQAKGDPLATTAGAGGFILLEAGSYADTPTSAIKVAGIKNGQGGIVQVICDGLDLSGIQSALDKYYAFLVNPFDIEIWSSATDLSTTSPNFNLSNLAKYSRVNFYATDNISVESAWSPTDPGAASSISLVAENNIAIDNNIKAAKNWSINLVAGATMSSGEIDLSGSSFIQTQDGNINIWAANQVIINSGAIRTFAGGSITVTTLTGDVNTGTDVHGYLFTQNTAPFYKVDTTVNSQDLGLGGISTAAGGNVTINAGGNVISFLPIGGTEYPNAAFDGGTGAFGAQPGNVTITAGKGVFGHYVLANGVGTITAGGGDIGVPSSDLSADTLSFALSLINGAWNVFAPNGNIYVQDVRNPSGIFGGNQFSPLNEKYHHFNYDPAASVLFDAGDSVEITGYNIPHTPTSLGVGATGIPILFPPSLEVEAGAGGFVLDTTVILFPSPDQNLKITTHNGGGLVGISSGDPINLEMSESPNTHWTDSTSFDIDNRAATPPEINNPNPVEISISGSMKDINLYTSKATTITVGQDILNSGFEGENLHRGDVTSITAGGRIFNSPLYGFIGLDALIDSANPQQPGLWDSVFSLAIDPSMVDSLAAIDVNALPGSQTLAHYLKSKGYMLFPDSDVDSSVLGANPGFIYSGAGIPAGSPPPPDLQIGFKGPLTRLSSTQLGVLEGGSIYVLVADSKGNPVIDANGHLEIATYNFSAAAKVAALDQYQTQLEQSKMNLELLPTTNPALGFLIGGPGQFNVTAASMDLGNSPGIVSFGFGGRYASLEPITGAVGSCGASVSIDVDSDINMVTSSINSIDGGNVNVHAGGDITLSQGNFDFKTVDCYGIYTSGHSDVNVTADGNINIGNGCIATFNGGNIFVESFHGDVDAGSGANRALKVFVLFIDPATGLPVFNTIGDLADVASLQADPAPYGSGIMAEFPTPKYQTPGVTLPGNVTIKTPEGNIVSGQGGISQFALDGTITGGPTITLEAGTPGVPATKDSGNILLGGGGIIGGTINVTASGDVQGFFVSRQNANINAGQSFSGTLLSGGLANLNAGGSVSGTLVGIGGVSASAGDGISANLLGQNVSVNGGESQSTLGTSAGATSTSQSAAQQSNNDVNEQVASNGTGDGDQKKDKGRKPSLTRRSRVTVILPHAS